MWEDPQNKDGGKFVLSMPKSYRSEGRTDECWLYTVLAVIGETMDESGEEVCGCVVSIRKSQDRIALWLKSSDRKKCTEVSCCGLCYFCCCCCACNQNLNNDNLVLIKGGG
jgi:translation initiation factor 4E